MINTIELITTRELKLHGACLDGIKWFKNNIGSMYIKDLLSVEGDYNNYIHWLKEEFLYSTHDSKGNILIYETSDGYSYTKTYDSKGNELSFKDSDGYSWTRTYDTKDGYFIQTLNGDIELKMKIKKQD